MKTKKAVAIHLLCWILILSYFYIGILINRKESSTRFNYLSLSMTFIQIVQFYICYLWVYPSFLKKVKVPQLIAGLAVAMAVFTGLRYLIEEMLYPAWLGFSNYVPGTAAWFYIKDNLYYGSSYIIISAAVWSTQQAFKNERAHQQLKDEAIKAELSFLKSQINPHFLYNTLNYIYSLAIPVSNQLAEAVLRLSDLMRYTLTESADGKVSLTKEVEYLQSYIELFRMRFEPHFYVEFITEGITEQQRIAPLLLIPFVENAFKHGVLNQEAHPVKLTLKVFKNQLSFEVNNTINNNQKDRSSGIGLVNVYRRLDLIYPGRYKLDIQKRADLYQTILTMQL